MLSWAGNAINDGANVVSSSFYATGGAEYTTNNITILSANFITKDIYISTASNGDKSAFISSNINNFSMFNYIDLAGYIGTASIYEDGHYVETDGTHVFDSGIIFGNAIINNNAYANISDIEQTQHFLSVPLSFSLTGFADNVHLINTRPAIPSSFYSATSIHIFDDATAASRVHVELAKVTEANVATDLNLILGNTFSAYTDTPPAYHSEKINGGTFAVTSHYSTQPIKEILNINSNFTHSELTLSGGSNHITDICLNGFALGGKDNYLLQLNIAADFTDSLSHVYVDELTNPNGNLSPISVDIRSEVGGTGGSDFFNTLNALQNYAQFSDIINMLDGEQLMVEGASQDDSFSVIGNTTIIGHGSGFHGDNFNFIHSSITSLVKISDYNTAADQITAGEGERQWSFSQAGDSTLVSYGDYSNSTDLNTLFSTLGGATDAQSLFTAALSKATSGASEHSLAEVGAIKLENSLYVIIDKNGNHTFDNDDIVFSLGNRDINQTVADVHYSATHIEVNGSTVTATDALI